MDDQEQVQEMLGGRSPAEFIKLPEEERRAYYQEHLVTEEIVQIEEGDDNYICNPELANGDMLRQEYFVGDDAAGVQVVREAREVYYTENTFAVRSHWLCEFLIDTLADEKPFPVDSLIRNIVIIVDTKHTYDSDQFEATSMLQHEIEGEEADSGAVWDLKQLLALENAEWIGIEIRGGGALDGSDLQTQLKIQEISGVIKQLITRFPGERFSIKKIQRKPGSSYAAFHDLKPYWTPPTAQTKQNLQHCRASFAELMQVQISEWTRELPERVTVEDLIWESLL